MFDDWTEFDERLLEERFSRAYCAGGNAYGGTWLLCEECVKVWAELEGFTLNTYTMWGGSPTYYAGDLAAGAAVYPVPVGEEFDSPPSCEDCGEFVRAALTHDGADYVRENLPRYAWHLWGLR